LILVAASMVVFIGMAGFAVDFGWIYLQSSNVKKASEAAALAAVIHMPLATPQAAGSEILTGNAAAKAADDIALEHGYSSTATQTFRWAKPSQVRVEISSSTNTFFLAFFGIDTIDLKRHAIAEQLPPLKLGGDVNQMGSSSDHYWLGINGQRRGKADGDPFSTYCTNDNHGCRSNQNTPQRRSPAYYYALDVPATDVGERITVSVFDGSGSQASGNPTTDYPQADGEGDGDDTFTFSVIAPDATPGDPTDNRGHAGGEILGCTRTFSDDEGANAWGPVCTFNPTKQGIHVVEVSVGGYDSGLNGFALRATGGSGGVSIYGLGFMSLWMVDQGSSPTLQVVRLDEVYAGSQIIISAFDLGDIDGRLANGEVSFLGSMAGLDCKVRVWNHGMTDDPVPDWRDDDSPGVAPCSLVTKSSNTGSHEGKYNNEWVEFLFDIPPLPTYSCSGSACWATIRYTFSGGTPVDRTTWGARINGTPVHLLNESTPSS